MTTIKDRPSGTIKGEEFLDSLNAVRFCDVDSPRYTHYTGLGSFVTLNHAFLFLSCMEIELSNCFASVLEKV